MIHTEAFPLVNYHSHTWRCKHAAGTEEEYVRKAIESGFTVLGFTDHTPWPYPQEFENTVRMSLSQLPDYIATVRALGDKYADHIHIPLGLECEAFPSYLGWLADVKAQYLDYLILGNHYELTDENGGFYFGRCRTGAHVRRYVECTIAGMETGMFAYLAHPDLFCRTYPAFDGDCAAASRDLCAAAKALDMPLEYNLLGIQYHDRDHAAGGLGYPYEGFWEIAAETGCRVILGLDAHRTEQLGRLDLFDAARRYLSELGMEIVPSLDI